MREIVVVGSVSSTILAIAACIPYAVSIIRGRTRPHQFSWLVFMIMNGIVTISQLLAGGRASVLISAVFWLSSIVNYLLSVKYGLRDTSPYDRLLFGLSLFTVIIWVVTKSNGVAIWLTVAIDVFATTMILLKIKRHPDSEQMSPWLLASAGYVLACLTLITTPIGLLYIRPSYGLLSDMVVIAAIWYFSRGLAGLQPEQTSIQRPLVSKEGEN
jgi:hypothetical protein